MIMSHAMNLTCAVEWLGLIEQIFRRVGSVDFWWDELVVEALLVEVV